MERERRLFPRWMTVRCADCRAPRGTHAPGCPHAQPLADRLEQAVRKGRDRDAAAAGELDEQADQSW